MLTAVPPAPAPAPAPPTSGAPTAPAAPRLAGSAAVTALRSAAGRLVVLPSAA